MIRRIQHALLLTFFGISLFSCQSNQGSDQVGEPETLEPLTIVDKGTKSFPLDAETAVDYNSRFRVNVFDGKEYLSFANRPASRIYEFDYESGEPTRKIKLESEGPNAVNLFFNIGMFFQAKDSIFLDSGGFGYYLVNGDGQVLNKAGMPQKENTMDPSCCPILFTNGTYFKENKIYGTQWVKTEDEKEIKAYAYGSIDLIDNSKSKKLLEKRLFVPNYEEINEMVEKKDPWVSPLDISYYYEGELLYAGSPISDTVYVFKDFELTNRFYVGKSNIELADYRSMLLTSQIQQIQNGYQNVSQIDQPPHFADVFVSPDGQMIYRVLIEATRAKKIENSDQEFPEVAKASLIVLNKTTGQLSTLDLPVDELDIPLSTQSRSVFVSSAGIHFETKEQVEEDRLDFRVFGVK
ncbi:DUF4221 family protein [Roseivirga sp.]|uniref:DUF4221 family protein n=1 Tax=Roseivirga sp. TaxID=1964215 RepID=UPI003B52A125